MKFVVLLLAAAAANLAAPTIARETATPLADEPKQAKEAEKICRMVALDTGSRRKERLCLTASEWRKFNNPR